MAEWGSEPHHSGFRRTLALGQAPFALARSRSSVPGLQGEGRHELGQRGRVSAALLGVWPAPQAPCGDAACPVPLSSLEGHGKCLPVSKYKLKSFSLSWFQGLFTRVDMGGLGPPLIQPVWV